LHRDTRTTEYWCPTHNLGIAVDDIFSRFHDLLASFIPPQETASTDLQALRLAQEAEGEKSLRSSLMMVSGS
jgi:hypothetical protein